MSTITGTAPTASLAVSFDQIPIKPVHWFMRGFFPFRHVTLVVAARGTAKGITVIDGAARMTRHDLMPGETEYDEFYSQPMDVLIMAGEDDANESVAGRLAGAGAVLDRVHNGMVGPDGQRFSIPDDIASLDAMIQGIEYEQDAEGNLFPKIAKDGLPHKVGMVILDPLFSLVGEHVNLNNRAKARAVIEELEAVAKHNLVVVLTHHTNADGKAAGSRALVEAVRNEVTLSRLPQAPDDSLVRVMTVSKTNIGITGLSQRYMLAGTIETPTIVWACEAPPEDTSRGYDIAPSPGYSAGAVSVPSAGRHASASAPTVPLAAVIGEHERYRAVWLTSAPGSPRKPQVINDYPTPELAMQACEHVADQALTFSATPTPGMQGATVAETGSIVYYGVLDRFVKAGIKSAA